MPTSAFCIHGHFYQPPREDPLTGEIPIEEGAYPYQNWNERILAQCYQPNAELGNFSRISFNLGPTLLEWMSETHPDTLTSITDQEKSTFINEGHPNGMAQAYNHTILPLASRKDKQTQIKWGMQEFHFRFGHPADGIWLPEAAVDFETLSVVYDCGVKYVILAPWQCADRSTDLGLPGLVELGEGKRIAVFFYNQVLSTRVSFDPGATRNADDFLVGAVLPEFSNGMGVPGDRFVIIASDGELYGHHQRFRDKFLARLTTNSIKGKPVEQMSPSAWLNEHPPKQVVRIVENSSWSCHHGVTRWSEECSCTPNSYWKAPLRSALNTIADIVDDVFENVLGEVCDDPYRIRDDYIQVILGIVSMDDFIHSHIKTSKNTSLSEQVGFLLRAQYERQRMFTSCGWFFDDFDRIEPRNNVKYAAQAIWLTRQVKPNVNISEALEGLAKVCSSRTGLCAESVFLKHLEKAQTAWAAGPSRD